MPEAQADLDKFVEEHPEAADDLRSTLAILRQAHQQWIAGKYPTFEDAVEQLTGQRPQRIDEIDDDLLPDGMITDIDDEE